MVKSCDQKVIDITSKIKRLKWRWARQEDKTNGLKIVTRWYPRVGKRKEVYTAEKVG